MVLSLPQSYASFEQQSTNLVDDCRATHHPTLAHAMQGLQIQLVISLDRYKAHRRPCDSLSDRLGIDIVALVCFHVRLHTAPESVAPRVSVPAVLGQENAHLRRLPCQSTRRVRWL